MKINTSMTFIELCNAYSIGKKTCSEHTEQRQQQQHKQIHLCPFAFDRNNQMNFKTKMKKRKGKGKKRKGN